MMPGRKQHGKCGCVKCGHLYPTECNQIGSFCSCCVGFVLRHIRAPRAASNPAASPLKAAWPSGGHDS